MNEATINNQQEVTMTNRSELYISELRTQSEALIDLAHILTNELPKTASERLTKALPDVIVQEIKGGLSLRNRAIEQYEKWDTAVRATEARYEKKRVELRVIALQLPTEFGVEIAEDQYDGPFLKGKHCSFEIKKQGNYGDSTKLVVGCNYESRSLPRKKDGTFSIDKAIAFIREKINAKVAKEQAQGVRAQKEVRFKQLIVPFAKYGVYGLETEIRINDDCSVKIMRSYDEKKESYIVWRTVREVVTPEQLTELLTNEVGVKKEAVNS